MRYKVDQRWDCYDKVTFSVIQGGTWKHVGLRLMSSTANVKFWQLPIVLMTCGVDANVWKLASPVTIPKILVDGIDCLCIKPSLLAYRGRLRAPLANQVFKCLITHCKLTKDQATNNAPSRKPFINRSFTRCRSFGSNVVINNPFFPKTLTFSVF